MILGLMQHSTVISYIRGCLGKYRSTLYSTSNLELTFSNFDKVHNIPTFQTFYFQSTTKMLAKSMISKKGDPLLSYELSVLSDASANH